MELQVIGVGFGRTGTDSLRVALNRLGFPCYHMHEVMRPRNQKSHLAFWNRVADAPPGTPFDWQEVFADYRAVVDNPAACVWRELVLAYPQAKVLLTHHPGGAEAWYQSTVETIYSTDKRTDLVLVRRIVPTMRQMSRMASRLIWGRFYEGKMDDRAAMIERYERHSRDVAEAVPAERLLVYSVDQGWEPLCEFLGVPVPNEPFPRVNDRAEFQRRLRVIGLVGNVVLLALAAGLLGLVYWLVG
ncbi:MAG: sulfotransferase [Myxococcota bacterium]|nr:sulfotransferase [Myxococcota bacterium]